MTRPGISICMIVKDEEALLGGALESLRGFATEVLVGDTGSTDRTKAIAAEAGAMVLDVPWTDDFAAARNAVLSHATQPWILYFDADERAGASVGPWLQQNLADLPPGGYRGVFVSRQIGRGFDRMCLFPNHQGIRWDRPIHEWPVWADGTPLDGPIVPALQFEDVGLVRSEAMERAKHERYVAMLLGELAKRPDSQLDLYYLAISLMAIDRYDEAYERLMAAYEEPRRRALWVPGALEWLLTDVTRLQRDWPRSRRWAEATLAAEPGWLQAYEVLLRGLHEHEGIAACLEPSARWLQACRLTGRTPQRLQLTHPTLVADAQRYRVWSLMAHGRMAEAQAIIAAPGAPPDLQVHWLLSHGDLEAAVELYAADRPDLATWRRWLHSEAPQPQLLPAMIWGSLRPTFYVEQADRLFNQVVADYPDHPLPRWRRGQFRLQRHRDPRPAMADLEQAAAADPGNAAIAALLANARQRALAMGTADPLAGTGT